MLLLSLRAESAHSEFHQKLVRHGALSTPRMLRRLGFCRLCRVFRISQRSITALLEGPVLIEFLVGWLSKCTVPSSFLTEAGMVFEKKRPSLMIWLDVGSGPPRDPFPIAILISHER